MLVILLPLLTLLTGCLYSWRRLLPLLTSGRNTRLSFSPRQLSGAEIIFLLLVFFFRSLSNSVYTALRGVNRHTAQITTLSSALDHDLYLSMPFQVTQTDLDDYVRAVSALKVHDFRWNNVQLAMLLSALTEPAMLLLLASKDCEVRPLGGVNVRNRFELLRPELCTPERLKVLDQAILLASYSKVIRRVKRGFEIDLTVSLNVPSSHQGGFTTAYRQIFTMLQFAKFPSDAPVSRAAVQEDSRLEKREHTSFSMRFQEPIAWANVCKDYNPIHFSALIAKIFGFAGKLGHGNHIAAKSWDVLVKETSILSDPALSLTPERLWMDLAFKRPVILPAHLDVFCGPFTSHGDGVRNAHFQVVSKEKACLEGTVGILE